MKYLLPIIKGNEMKFEPVVLEILKHFASLGNAIIIEPNDTQHLYIASETRRLVARARNIEKIDLELPIFNLKQFTQIFGMFSDREYTISVEDYRAYIRSTDGVYNQSFGLSDPDILDCPKPEKVDKLFDGDLEEFEFSSSDMAQIQKAVQINGVKQITFLVENGEVHVLAANMTEKGKIEDTGNQFKFNTGIKTAHDFYVGLPAEVLKEMLPGDYKIGIARNLIRFKAPEDGRVDYICPTLNYSKFTQGE